MSIGAGRRSASTRRKFLPQAAVTTAIDTGSAGAGYFAGFRKHVIELSAVRILAYLHVSFAGICAFSKTVMVGESEELRLMAPAEAVAVAEANRDVIIGIKVRVGRHASGTSGTAPLDIALQAANEAGLPLMCHIDFPPPSYEEVVERLRPGDVLTHAFRPFPNATPRPAGPRQGRGRAHSGARARRAVRYRPRQGLVARGEDRARHAGERLLSGHHLVRRARAVHRGPGLRTRSRPVEVPVHGHAAQ